MNDILLIILEKVCEAIYFSLFLILGKNIKEKRLLFIGIMIFEYLILKYFIKFNIYFQVAYTFMSFINLKVLYKEKAQITDIFLFGAASILLIALSTLTYIPVYLVFKNNVVYFWYVVSLIINRILLFALLYFSRNKINKIYKKFYSHWNRPKQPGDSKIKSLTLRNISIIIFNLMFYIINIGMLFALTINVLY